MKVIKTDLEGVDIIEPTVFKDDRGYFFESFNLKKFAEIYPHINFVQDNESYSAKNTFRGMHYQTPPFAQTKLVRVVQGNVIDFALDIRKGSPTYGKHVAVELSADNKRQLLVPRGFAHGFLVKSDSAIFQYKVDNFYSKEHERSISISSTSLAENVHDLETLILSEKDKNSTPLANADLFTFGANLYE